MNVTRLWIALEPCRSGRNSTSGMWIRRIRAEQYDSGRKWRKIGEKGTRKIHRPKLESGHVPTGCMQRLIVRAGRGLG